MDPATAAASAGVADSARPVAPADPAGSGSANPAGSGAAGLAGSGSANQAGPGSANPARSGSANPAGSGSANPARPGSANPAGSGSANPAGSGSPFESGAVGLAGSGAAGVAGSGAAGVAGSGAAGVAGSGSRPESVRPTGSKLAAGPSGPGGPGASMVKCRVREILGRVGDKWSLFVIFRLGDGPQRFTALKRSVEGVSQRMLTVTLRGLERDGIVSRTMYPVMPPRVDYALTPLGHTLLDAVGALMAWADEHLAEVDAARAAYDASSARAAHHATPARDAHGTSAHPFATSTSSAPPAAGAGSQ